MTELAIHYGIQPLNDDRPAMLGLDIAQGEHRHLCEWQVTVAGYRGLISGSWLSWGADPDEEHDRSLHVVFLLNPDDEDIHGQADVLTAGLLSMLTRLAGHGHGRLMDYAVITDATDWSVGTHHVSTGPGPTYLDVLAY